MEIFQSTRPVRGATQPRVGIFTSNGISIHAPRAGRDWQWTTTGGRWFPFQSTRPVRGATEAPAKTAEILKISIHAPRAGRDGIKCANILIV